MDFDEKHDDTDENLEFNNVDTIDIFENKKRQKRLKVLILLSITFIIGMIAYFVLHEIWSSNFIEIIQVREELEQNQSYSYGQNYHLDFSKEGIEGWFEIDE